MREIYRERVRKREREREKKREKRERERERESEKKNWNNKKNISFPLIPSLRRCVKKIKKIKK